MVRQLNFTAVCLFAVTCLYSGGAPVYSQVNESKEFPDVYHSPAADSTPPWYRSVLQMEVVVKKGDEDAQIQYANGTVVSKDGLLVSVLDAPDASNDGESGIQSAAVLLLDGSSAPVELVKYEPTYGVAVFRAKGLDVRPIRLSKAPPVAKRQINWHTVYRRGPKTYLYTRPLEVHKATYQVGGAEDLCEVTCKGVSGLSSDRTGSALVALDGTLLGIMGYQKSWNVTPKNAGPRQKFAWAVPANVLERLLEEATN